MISIQKRFIFIHVPKTGGNSLQNILRDYSEDKIVTNKYQDGVERFEVRSRQYNKLHKHSTLSCYKSIISKEIYRSAFKFATIRNPWDRMVSFYFSPHRGVTEWDRDKFIDLVNVIPTLQYYICEPLLLEKVTRKLGMKFTVNDREINRDIDFLIRFEQLDTDFKLLCDKLDIPHTSLPNRNSSEREHYSRYYDEELKEIVQEKFIEEINFGRYSFEYS